MKLSKEYKSILKSYNKYKNKVGSYKLIHFKDGDKCKETLICVRIINDESGQLRLYRKYEVKFLDWVTKE